MWNKIALRGLRAEIRSDPLCPAQIIHQNSRNMAPVLAEPRIKLARMI